jgi:F-type H+-transporting ATPase subunit b
MSVLTAGLPLDAPLSGVEVMSADNPLLEASPGLMVWTVVLFGITLLILKRYAFGPIAQALERRRQQIAQSIADAEASRDEALRLLEQYQAQLAEARREADELRERARREGERQRDEILDAAAAQRDRILRDTEELVQAQAREAMTGLRDEVVVLALSAAQKVTGKSLTEEDHRRLIEEAIREADLTALGDGRGA